MNTFSITVSNRLREIGVEGETGLYFRWWHSPIEEYRTPTLVNETQLKELSDPILIPAYRLDDIFSLMPKIGEKLSFNEIEQTCEIAEAFAYGDYPEAEIYLLDLLKEHAQPKE